MKNCLMNLALQVGSPGREAALPVSREGILQRSALLFPHTTPAVRSLCHTRPNNTLASRTAQGRKKGSLPPLYPLPAIRSPPLYPFPTPTSIPIPSGPPVA